MAGRDAQTPNAVDKSLGYPHRARIARWRISSRVWRNLMAEALTFIDVGEGADARGIAVRTRAGAAPGLFWLGGFKSDMQGTKAAALAAFAAERGRGIVRVDYSGHGESNGALVDGTVGR